VKELRCTLYDDRGAEQDNHAGKMQTSAAVDKTDENPSWCSPVIDRCVP